MTSRLARFCIALALCAIVAGGATELLAGKPGGGGGSGCPTGNCICTMEYCPVTCNGGCRYSNSCFASCAGATGCVPDFQCPIILEP